MALHDLFAAAAACLSATDPDQKIRLTRETAAAFQAGYLSSLHSGVAALDEPGRPPRPLLVHPRHLEKRRPNTPEGRAVLFHALAHIEFNAINLAWDAVQRFRDLPLDYYRDWVQVADEEAYHFRLLRDHLRGLGYDYGDFPAHDGLWEMAQQTEHDPLVRMALIPRNLEARGLDVSPGIKARLLENGDTEGAALLDIILRDEIGHVAMGDRWFRYLCQERGREPMATYRELLNEYMKAPLRGPFHIEARRQAGFSEEELTDLQRTEGAR